MPLLSAGRNPAKAGLPETLPWLLLLLESWAWQTLPFFGEIQAHFDQVQVNTVVSLRALEKHAGRHTVLILLLRMETQEVKTGDESSYNKEKAKAVTMTHWGGSVFWQHAHRVWKPLVGGFAPRCFDHIFSPLHLFMCVCRDVITFLLTLSASFQVSIKSYEFCYCMVVIIIFKGIILILWVWEFYLDVCLHTTCMPGSCGSQWIRFLGTGVTDDCELLCGRWEQNSDLGEVSSTESPLQALETLL